MSIRRRLERDDDVGRPAPVSRHPDTTNTLPSRNEEGLPIEDQRGISTSLGRWRRADSHTEAGKRIPTQVGDVLILWTEQSFTIYVVGPVFENDQQDIRAHVGVQYVSDCAAAFAAAKALVGSGQRIFLQSIDTGSWSEISP